MRNQDDQIKVVEAMAKREEMIGQIYTIFAKKFPEHKNFWTQIAKEEDEHARLLRTITINIMEGSLSLTEERFEKERLAYSMDYIQDRLASAENVEGNMTDALKIALDIEDSLVEKGFLKIFKGDAPRLKEILNSLILATEVHRERIRAILAKGKI
ncbi:MAG: hypothetical protein HQ575_05825 [Candidatus Omnitrophica bacterium]|nr:hypothetical protein [Candidatus Omnitrophota bacterium]